MVFLVEPTSVARLRLPLITMDAMGGPAWRRRFSREDDGDHGGGGDGDNAHLMMATFRVMAYR